MKKTAMLLVGTALFLMPLMSGFADDATDLNKLKPLTTSEQSMYVKVKNNTSELHNFIVTRMYFRTALRLIKEQNMNPVPSKMSQSDLGKFSPLTKDVTFGYTTDLNEQMLLYNIMVKQGLYTPTVQQK